MRFSDEAPADQRWRAFCELNRARRAIRDFDSAPVADDDVRSILAEGLLAPSSGNLQPYRVHWVRDAATKQALAAVCNGQRAAASAPVLLVFTAGIDAARSTAAAQLQYVNTTTALTGESKRYHRGQLEKFRRFMRWGTLAIWTPVHAAVSTVWPALTLLPIGSGAARHWAARSAIYAAQTVLLAAAARGLDSCPMEGFNARKVAAILGMPRNTVVPVIIAIGSRRKDARVEPRWRRPFSDAVAIH